MSDAETEVREAEQRKACGKEIYKILKRSKLPSPLKMSQAIEEGVFEQAKGRAERERVEPNWENTIFRRIYRDHLSTVIQNLDPTLLGNKSLITRLREGSLEPASIASMSREELFPDRWEEIIKRAELEEEVKEKPRGTISTQYTCGRCKCKRIEVAILQTRSADEGSTIFFTCTSCGHGWRG